MDDWLSFFFKKIAIVSNGVDTTCFLCSALDEYKRGQAGEVTMSLVKVANFLHVCSKR